MKKRLRKEFTGAVSHAGGIWPAANPEVCIIDGKGYIVGWDAKTYCIGPYDETGKTIPASSPDPILSRSIPMQQERKPVSKILADENHEASVQHVQTGINYETPETNDRGRGRPRKTGTSPGRRPGGGQNRG